MLSTFQVILNKHLTSLSFCFLCSEMKDWAKYSLSLSNSKWLHSLPLCPFSRLDRTLRTIWSHLEPVSQTSRCYLQAHNPKENLRVALRESKLVNEEMTGLMQKLLAPLKGPRKPLEKFAEIAAHRANLAFMEVEVMFYIVG